MKKFRGVEIIAFCAITLLLLAWVNGVFRTPDDRPREWVTDFYHEAPNTLDVVAIGPSSMYTFWQPALAWDAFGFTSWNLTSPGMPYTAPLLMLKEALKTQNPKVFVVEAGTFLYEPTLSQLHALTDSLPWSSNKLTLIDESCDDLGMHGFDRLEFYLPILRFHKRWTSLRLDNILPPDHIYKGSTYYGTFLKNSADFEYDYEDTGTAVPPSGQLSYLVAFLDYCKANHLAVVFLAAPNTVDNKEELQYVRSVVEGYGYPFVMAIEHMDEIGLKIPEDFYNDTHTNLHGSIKCIAWFGRYLKNHFDLPDHRGKKGYLPWDEAYRNYLNLIKPYIGPHELDGLESA